LHLFGSKGYENGDLRKYVGCAKQAVRSGCQGCSTCEGFEIWFRAADANDPNVMLFCSRCGCATDKHIVDQASKLRYAHTVLLIFMLFGHIYNASQGLCFDLCRTGLISSVKVIQMRISLNEDVRSKSQHLLPALIRSGRQRRSGRGPARKLPGQRGPSAGAQLPSRQKLPPETRPPRSAWMSMRASAK
jgi:hypothetical protein